MNNNTMYAVEIDDDLVLVRDGAINLMLDQGMELEDIAKKFMVSLDDVKSILLE